MVYQSSSVSHCINMLRKVARRLFILSQLALAMYYSNNAITSWNDSPIVTSVKMTSIQNIQFPSVTVCYDINQWKWPGIVHAMSKLDTVNFAENYYSYQDNTFVSRVKASELIFRKSQLYKKANTNTTTIGFIKEILPKDLQSIGLFLHLISYFEPFYKISSFIGQVATQSYLLKMQNGKMDLSERSSTLFDIICSSGDESSNKALKYCSEVSPTLDTSCDLEEFNKANKVRFFKVRYIHNFSEVLLFQF